jgi:hypothetical protein
MFTVDEMKVKFKKTLSDLYVKYRQTDSYYTLFNLFVLFKEITTGDEFKEVHKISSTAINQ